MDTGKIATTEQMRALEQGLVDAGASWPGLMEHAGWGIAQEALRLLADARGIPVVILVGPGNNGGDGLVVARHLHDAGAHVALYVWKRPDDGTDANRNRCHERAIVEHHAADDPDQHVLRQVLARARLVVDALLGLGVNRAVGGDLAQIISAVNQARAEASTLAVLAVDLPTGIASDTGALLGHAIQADVSVATGMLKRGMLFPPGRTAAGTIVVADIGLTHAQLETVMSEQIHPATVRSLLPARPDDSHKGTYGKAMIVAGSILYPGASSLASGAALRVGAGLVTLATARSALGAPGRLPEITLRPLPDSGGYIAEAAADELLKHLEGYSALLIGPGMGHEKETHGFVERLFGVAKTQQRGAIGFRLGAVEKETGEPTPHELPPTVIDADGLNILSEIDQWWEQLPRGRCVLTPHPGEMKRLLKAEDLPSDLVQAAQDAAKQWGQVVVLKGATTVVADPQGRTAVHAGGNAALATAGTGDVLAGVIAGLLAQKLELFDAAVAGVFIHSAAGMLLREELGDAGTIASDLLPRLPRAIKQIKG